MSAASANIEWTAHLDIAYPDASDPRQSLDLFLPSSAVSGGADNVDAASERPLVVFIHGGAWRSGSKSELHETLLPRFKAALSCPIALLEYRLSPAHPHPAHIQDVVAGVTLLTSDTLLPCEGSQPQWSRSKLVIVGHSAGAFMIFQLLLSPSCAATTPITADPSSRPLAPDPKRFDVPAQVRASIRAVVPVDGIYDLVSLVNEYPSYAEFVEQGFGSDIAGWGVESPTRWILPYGVPSHEDEDGANDVCEARPVVNGNAVAVNGHGDQHANARGKLPDILLLHSQEDELLSLRQPEVMVARLFDLLGPDEMERSVKVDYETLKGTHFGILEKEELAQAVKELVVNVQ